MRRIVACMAVLWLCDVTSSYAQTILNVPYGAAHFAWDIGGVDASHSAATKHTIVCGAVAVDVPMPATSIAVSSVIPGPGIYACELYASNAFGRQKDPNLPFPQFEAGYEPVAPSTLRIEVRP